MKEGSSVTWRAQGDAIAFDHTSFEFRSRLFYASVQEMLGNFDACKDKPNFQIISLIPTAKFLASLALELIAKAYYLKSRSGPREAIYNHDVASLFGAGFFSESQEKLMGHAAQCVVWGGRYPTPVWKREQQKEAYDVQSDFVEGMERISTDIPNMASRGQIDELLELYLYIHLQWQNLN